MPTFSGSDEAVWAAKKFLNERLSIIHPKRRDSNLSIASTITHLGKVFFIQFLKGLFLSIVDKGISKYVELLQKSDGSCTRNRIFGCPESADKCI